MRRVYTTIDPVEAAMLEMVLRGEGIEVSVENENVAHLVLGTGNPVAPLTLVVGDKDEKAARAAIDEAIRNRKADDGNPETPDPDS
jgi:hypothetical protein